MNTPMHKYVSTTQIATRSWQQLTDHVLDTLVDYRHAHAGRMRDATAVHLLIDGSILDPHRGEGPRRLQAIASLLQSLGNVQYRIDLALAPKARGHCLHILPADT